MKKHLILFSFYVFAKLIMFLDLQLRFFPEITFLNVGQGDAILISTPSKGMILIDGGPGYTVDLLLNDYFPLNNCKLDSIFLTHPHQDHLEGLMRVLDHCSVKNVFFNPVSYDSVLYTDWKQMVQDHPSLNVHTFVTGDSYYFDGWNFQCIWPDESYLGFAPSNVNNTSLVIMAEFGDYVSAFLTGDAEKEVLSRILNSFYLEQSRPTRIYKTSHHGANNGFVAALWEVLDPHYTVISVGAGNKFGHPGEEILRFLEDRSSVLKRTDMDGTVKIRYNSL